MNKLLNMNIDYFLSILLVVFIFSGCSAENSSIDPTVKPDVNVPPIVKVASDFEGHEDSIIALSAEVSDLDGAVLTTNWRQISGIKVTLKEAMSVNATFIAPQLTTEQGAQILVFELTVMDDSGATTTDSVSVTIHPINEPPLVNVDPNLEGNEGSTVVLSGEVSDTDGVIKSTHWKQLKGVSVEIKDPFSIQTTFMAPSLSLEEGAQILVFELTVTDNEGAVNTDSISITIHPINEPPLVNVGPNQEGNEGNTVTLSGEVSDTDGVIKSTHWKQLKGVSVEIKDPFSIQTTFIAPSLSLEEGAQILVFELTVTDNEGTVNADSISITIHPINEPPLVNAGSDFEGSGGSLIMLSGEVSDTDGAIKSTLWKQLKGISVEINDPFSTHTTFVAPAFPLEDGAQILVFELTVTDNEGAVNTDSISITITPVDGNPIAKAGEDKILAPNSEVTLDCSKSYDPEGSDLDILWVQISGSPIKLSDNFSCLTSFNLPNKAEVFEFALTVTNKKGKSNTDFVSVTSTPAELPLLSIDSFVYQGGFRLSAATFGDTPGAKLDYSPGVIAFNPENNSLFVVGHPSEQGIAEFKIPEIVNSKDIADFVRGEEVIQKFSKFQNTDRVDTGIGGFFWVTGMELIGSKLVVNYFSWYDAPGLETDTTVVFQNAADLSSSIITGPFQIDGSAHASGWMTPIPDIWQALLNGTHISGWVGGSISSRLSNGPSGWVLSPEVDLINVTQGGRVVATPALDFTPENLLYDKSVYGDTVDAPDDILYNLDLKNKLWTAVSGASYGFIIEGTNTYATFGYTGGMEFGAGYKITQDTGRLCPGPCPKVAADHYNYLWLWKVSELAEVINGEKQPYDVRPYEHGPFDTITKSPIKGGAYDSATMSLYISLFEGDTAWTYDRPPLFLKYKINVKEN